MIRTLIRSITATLFPLLLFAAGCSHTPAAIPVKIPVTLNDIHSQLNSTVHSAILSPTTIVEIQSAILGAKRTHQFISISGGRHSMGGQQFGAGTINLNMSSFNQVIGLDSTQGIVEVQSGIQWPELVQWLLNNQDGFNRKWGIRQKQTGADRLSIGGALASNIHGRGLKMRPMIDDVESFTLIDANGDVKTCSRTENSELFHLAIGGYGLFGVIGSVKVRLAPVQTLERVVDLIEVKDFIHLVTARTNEGYLYGDFQFAIDSESDDFMKRGIYSLYRPVNKPLSLVGKQQELKDDDWHRLLGLAHTDKSSAFDIYSKFYRSTVVSETWLKFSKACLRRVDDHQGQAARSSVVGASLRDGQPSTFRSVI